MIFLDTGFLFAYVSADDKDHARVNEVLEAHRGERLADVLLTTNHVVTETITLVSKRGHRDPGVRHDLAVKIGHQLHAGVFAQVHHASAEEELEAFAYFERHPRGLGGGRGFHSSLHGAARAHAQVAGERDHVQAAFYFSKACDTPCPTRVGRCAVLPWW